MLLLWEATTLPEELSALSERQRGQGGDGVESKKILDSKNTKSKKLLFINEHDKVNLVGEESTWVADSGAFFT